MDENNYTETTLKRFLKALRMNESFISVILGALVVVVVGILIYNYFSSVNKSSDPDQVTQEGVTLVEEDGKLVPQGLPKTHTVTSGEHLWSIAEKYYESGYNWVDIAKENNLTDPGQITEGQELVIPKTAQIALEGQEPVVAGAADTPESILTEDYTVVAGDTLWKIAVRAYGDGYAWTKIHQANTDQVIDANVIEKGMVLKLPR